MTTKQVFTDAETICQAERLAYLQKLDVNSRRIFHAYLAARKVLDELEKSHPELELAGKYLGDPVEMLAARIEELGSEWRINELNLKELTNEKNTQILLRLGLRDE
jgi:hypothetical protein